MAVAHANVNVWPTMIVHPIIHEADHPRGREQRCKRCGAVVRRMTEEEGDRWSYLPGALLREALVRPKTWGGAREIDQRIGYRNEPFDPVRMRPTCAWRN